MQVMKRISAIALMGALGASALAGCNTEKVNMESGGSSGAASATTTQASGAVASSGTTGAITYPLTNAKKVSWYIQDGPIPHTSFKDASESPFHTGLIKQTGVQIDWSFPTTGADANSYTSTILADPQSMPNIMTGYFMNNATQYLDDEIIWDLTPYLQEYAPDYWKWLQSNPDYDKAMKTDDGRYYTFGFFREDGGWNDSYQGPVIRKDWLDECGLEMPKTIDDVENVLKVFKEKYGATFDAPIKNRWETMGLAGAFGAYGNDKVDGTWGYYIKDGKVQFAMAQTEWRNYLSWLNKLWDEGLIDQDFLSEDDTTIKSKVHNNSTGLSYTSMGQLNVWMKEAAANGETCEWVGMPQVTGNDGTLSCVFGGPGIGTQTTVITKTADEETMKTALQLLNYAYSDEGFLYWNYGVEGVSWEYGDDGKPKFTELVTNDTDTDPMTKYNGATWSGPDIQATNLLYQKNSKVAIEANNTWYYVYPDDMKKNDAVTKEWKWPVGITFTTAEADELDTISTDLPTYVDEAYAAFLTGAKNINDDAQWKAFTDGLETHNLSRILEIRQACYDRYEKR